MKKYILLAARLPFFLALLLWLQDSVIPKTFLYADDSINNFQQEIIYAKQKHEAISTKMDVVQAFMDSQQALTLQEEAQKLMQEVAEKDDSKGQANLQNKFVKELPKEAPAKKSSWVTHLKNSFKKEKPKAPVDTTSKKDIQKIIPFFQGFGRKEATISDGEALYKVAVSDRKV